MQVALIGDRLEQLDELDKRGDAVLKSLEERELLTDELKEKIETAQSLTLLEDIYLPYCVTIRFPVNFLSYLWERIRVRGIRSSSGTSLPSSSGTSLPSYSGLTGISRKHSQ